MSGNNGTTLTGPAQIQAWVFLSRMHQLALELNCPGLKHRMPILKAMYLEGLIDVELRGTRANKIMVLDAMVEQYSFNVPGWEPSQGVRDALAGGTK